MDMSTTTMDMESSTMAMTTSTGTATASAASASSTMAMDMAANCKINMLWNWYTIDACFLSSSWQITSRGMFAGSCIGVICLVMLLEFLRRASKEYDKYILLSSQKSHAQLTSSTTSHQKSDNGSEAAVATTTAACAPAIRFRPSILQQATRALFHMLQFATAYFIMLLAMYYNGYIIISIFIGSYLGAFVFSWETISLSTERKEEASYCCG